MDHGTATINQPQTPDNEPGKALIVPQSETKHLKKAIKKRILNERQSYPIGKVPAVITDFLADKTIPITDLMAKHNLTYRQIKTIKEDYQDDIDMMLSDIVRDAYQNLRKGALSAVERLRKFGDSQNERIGLDATEKYLNLIFDNRDDVIGGSKVPKMIINVSGGNARIEIGGKVNDKDLTPKSDDAGSTIEDKGVV